MSARAATLPAAPGLRWWLMLAVVITAGIAVNWAIAGGLLAVFLIQAARPLDFLWACLISVTAAAFVFNEGGGLTTQLGVVTACAAVMMFCYVIAMKERTFSLPRTSLTGPLLVFVGVTAANALRGLLTGAPAKNVGLELVPILGLGIALLLGSAFDVRRDLRLAFFAVVTIGYGVAIWGFIVFGITHSHSIGFYSMAIPGLVGVLLVNRALRAATSLGVLGWVALSVPLFLHQFITFGRGLWTGCIAALLFSAWLFTGFGRGTGRRWWRFTYVVSLLLGFALVGAIQAAVLFGEQDLLQQAITRFTSIGSVDTRMETRSNVIRLLEYARALTLVRQTPLFGRGVGYTFTVKDPFSQVDRPQWGVHQNFLMVLLKQGLIGLAAFIWMLWSATALGAREARRRTDPWEVTWLANSGAATIFIVAFSLSNYPLARVNESFMLAALWGVSMAIARQGLVTFYWKAPSPHEEGEAA